MNQLEQIFHSAPADCEEVRLSCRVYFKAPAAYILTGWLHYRPGCWERIEAQADQYGIWQRIEAQSEQPAISQAQLDKALLAAGWSMDARPVRRGTTELTYTFKRATGEHYAYQLRSKTNEYTERRLDERRLQSIDAHIGSAILQNPE